MTRFGTKKNQQKNCFCRNMLQNFPYIKKKNIKVLK